MKSRVLPTTMKELATRTLSVVSQLGCTNPRNPSGECPVCKSRTDLIEDLQEIVAKPPCFPNLAGQDKEESTGKAIEELEAAGLTAHILPGSFSTGGEVDVRVIGGDHGWEFKRAWRYWIAKGPGLPLEYAMPLHEKFGTSVRVDGHCEAPSPVGWFKGLPVPHYHVDTPEGLRALATAINAAASDGIMKWSIGASK